MIHTETNLDRNGRGLPHSETSNATRIQDIGAQIQDRTGISIDTNFASAITALSNYYRGLTARFENEALNETTVNGLRRELSPTQNELLTKEMSTFSADIEKLSQALRSAAKKLPQDPDTKNAHTEFSQKALDPELSQSAFANWCKNPEIKKITGPAGNAVLIAILTQDDFLRGAIIGAPALEALREVVKIHPIDPTTLAGAVVERSLLDVPVARDHMNRLKDLEVLMTNEMKRKKGAEFVVNNIACGTAYEVAQCIAANSDNPALGKTTINLYDFSPHALGLSRARITQTIEQGVTYRPKIECHSADVVKRIHDFQRADLLTAAGIVEYLTNQQTTDLAHDMSARAKPGALCVITQVSGRHPHREQQEHLISWSNMNYREKLDLVGIGHSLKDNSPGFDGYFRHDLEDMDALAKNPSLLLPGEFCVATHIDRSDPANPKPGTNYYLLWRMND